MTALELLAELRQAGIKISVREGHLRVKAKKNQLDTELQKKIGTHKEELLRLLTAYSAPTKTFHGDYIAPLSHAQKKLFFLQAYSPKTSAYNMAFCCDVEGVLDVEKINLAFGQLLLRHGALRTSFRMNDGDTSQVIVAPTGDEQLQFVPDDNGDEWVDAQIEKLAREPFDLCQAPLIRPYLFQRRGNRQTVLLVAHHIIFDMRSAEICLSELFTIYCALIAGHQPDLQPPPLDFGDFANWQHSPQRAKQLDAQLRYWSKQLADAPPTIELPTDFVRPKELSHSGGWLDSELDDSLGAALIQLAAQTSCTPSTIVFAVFQVFLARISASRDLVIGMPVESRNLVELEDTVGFFLNTLAIRFAVDGNPTFRSVLTKTRKCLLDAFNHNDLAFERLVEELQPERDLSRSPVFQVMYAWHDQTEIHLDGGSQASITSPIIVGTDTAKFDLTLAVFRHNNQIRLGFEYSSELFKESTITKFLQRFCHLLADTLTRPDLSIYQLEMMTQDERHIIQDVFNSTESALKGLCIHQYVEQAASQTPDTIAMEFGESRWSYHALNAQANRLARKLTEYGAGSSTRVAILVQRGPFFQLAMLATLKTGAAYVPLDPRFPVQRLKYLLEDSDPVLLLTESAVMPATDSLTIQCAVLDMNEFDFSAGDATTIDTQVKPEDPAYVIYTSGSTGAPKGVVLQHRGLGNLLEWQANQPGLNQPARTLHFAALCFDVSFTETFSTWADGGTLVLVDEDIRRDFPALQRFIKQHEIERIFLPCAALQPFAEALCSSGESGEALSYTDVIVSGEQLNITLPIRTMFEQHPRLRLHNHYGPAETHVVTGYTFPADRSSWVSKAPIGKPIFNTQIYLLDEYGELVPQGVIGELHIGGASIGPGYFNNSELSDAKFVPNRFSKNEESRLYRSGDLARFSADGILEYFGRIDGQVKLRGYRVEPGEVENALLACPLVVNAVAGVRNLDPSSSANAQLVAWVVVQDNAPIEIAELSTFLVEQLPDYMIPDLFVIVDELPMTPSGKIDRRALPDPDFNDTSQPYRAPETSNEIILCKLYADLLGIERIGTEDNFFHLGGQSLLTMRLVARISDQLGVTLPLKYVFQYPTPCKLGVAIAVIDKANHPGSADNDCDHFVL
jgi:surfactin family lipopeptide synthetase A